LKKNSQKRARGVAQANPNTQKNKKIKKKKEEET
jgi:hypothetical protein